MPPYDYDEMEHYSDPCDDFDYASIAPGNVKNKPIERNIGMELLAGLVAFVFGLICLVFFFSLSVSVVSFGFALGPISGVVILLIVLSIWFGGR